jgi:hypothetical protein
MLHIRQPTALLEEAGSIEPLVLCTVTVVMPVRNAAIYRLEQPENIFKQIAFRGVIRA